ncbi:class II aldolase/adducin family protein [Roseibium sp. CAU 1637]|uniref:Class II aldolase/adducin family protein n=1 Tax=Roseibium limicola TaxID=2816037 RepID=A0A939JBH4_9HYPH|nr:class II aldolase/adducin family protein [Roseibium limicola]MBO0347468.1 class II aldolase/adducin family protein [Roseibium limicola]
MLKTPYSDTLELRQSIIDTCIEMNRRGINQGTSGNISARAGDRMLITPSGVPYDRMTPEMLVSMPIDGKGDPEGDFPPSTEWQFHLALLRAKPEMHAVVHAHPVHCTALAINREEIPACHYMIAIFGGNSVPLAGYSLFGSEDLADDVTNTMRERSGCLMANHGAVVVGETLEKGLWRLEELEVLAKAYILSRTIGTPHILGDDEIGAVLGAVKNYGLKTT